MDTHRDFAKSSNQLVWKLLSQPRLNAKESETMIHAAHASCYHWLKAGTAVHHQRGLWLLSRAYSVANEPANALKYAQLCLEITEKSPKDMQDFDWAYAYEALARSHFLNKRRADGKKFWSLAQNAGEKIKRPEDKKLFFEDFKFGNLGK